MSLVGLAFFVACAALIIGGMVLLWTGARRQRDFGRPICRRCGYDLRQYDYARGVPAACPGCEAKVSAGGASFVRIARRPGRASLGLVCLLLPIPLFYATSFAMEYAHGARYRPTEDLIRSADWSSWRELGGRLKDGKLSASQVRAALDGRVKQWVKASPPRSSFDRRDTMDSAIGAHDQGLIDSATLTQVISALSIAPKLSFEQYDKAKRVLRLTVDLDDDLHTLRPVGFLRELLNDADKQTIGGVEHTSEPDYCSFHDGRTADVGLSRELSPGRQSLTAVIDCGLLPSDAPSLGLGGRPGTPDKWQSPVAVWRIEVPVTITVK